MPDEVAKSAPHPHVRATLPGVTLRAGVMGMGSHLYTLVITHDRLLFARSTTADLKRISATLRHGAKEAGSGRWAQLGAQGQAYEVLAQECARMDPDRLLAAHPKNFAVELNRVTKTKIKTVDSPQATSEDRLTIKTADKTYKMVLTGSSVARAREAMTTAGLL